MSEQLYRVVRGTKWHKRVLCAGGCWARVRRHREVEGYDLHLTAAEATARAIEEQENARGMWAVWVEPL